MTDVLVLTLDFPPRVGGIQTLVARLVESFPTYRALVVAPQVTGAAEFDAALAIRVQRVTPDPGRGRFAKAAFLCTLTIRALQTARRERPRVVLVSHVLLGPVAAAIRAVLGVPYVVWVHADEVAHRRPLVTRSLCAADRVIADSEHSRALALRSGAEAARSVVVGNGADLPAPGAAGACRPPDAPPTILMVARMDELYKGHDVVIRSLPLVSARVPSVRLVLIGDGAWRDYYRRLAIALGVSDRVVFLGRVPDGVRDAWLRDADVLAMPSRVRPLDGLGEGFGIVYLEAAAWGKPVLAGRAGGALDAVVDGVTGLLVEPESIQEVADGLARILTDRALAERLGEAGRQRVATTLSWASVAGRVESVLSELAEGRPRAR